MGSVALVVRRGPRVVQTVVDAAASKANISGDNVSGQAAAWRTAIGVPSNAEMTTGLAGRAAQNASNVDPATWRSKIEAAREVAWDPALVVSGARLLIKAGTYTISAPVDFSGVVDCEIICSPGVVFRDTGRLLTSAANSSTQARVPWGMRFDSTCSRIRWLGFGTISTGGSSLGGSSNAFFDATTYVNRRPVLWFDGVKDVTWQGYINGNPGVAVSPSDTIAEAVHGTPTLDQRDVMYARGFMVAFTTCSGAHADILGTGPNDAGGREQLFMGASTYDFSIRGATDSSTWGSLFKARGVYNGTIGPIRVNSTQTSSLFDVIGSNIRIFGIKGSYPGKMIDLSHEHGKSNRPCDNILVEDCRNDHPTGLVFTSVINQSDLVPTQITNNPITNVRLKDCVGAVQIGAITSITFERCRIPNLFYNGTPSLLVTSTITYKGCVFTMDATGAGRTAGIVGRLRAVDCDFVVDASNTTPLTVMKPTDAPAIGDESTSSRQVVLESCRLPTTVPIRTQTNVDFLGTDLAGMTLQKNSTTPRLRTAMAAYATPAAAA